MYFQLEKTGIDNPPAITHPGYYYGFVGVALAFQIVFLTVSLDPVRYRTLILASVFEKFAFVIPTFYLYSQVRAAGPIIAEAALDLIWGILFVVSYFKVSGHNPDVELASDLEN